MNIMNSTNDTTLIEDNPCILTAEQISEAYNLKIRIVSVFVLLTVSFLGASMSIASTRVKSLHINPIIINTGKFFGTGVILATGFVHILPDAMYTLSDPCLPDSWNIYSAYAGLFAMLATLGMQLIEYLAHERSRSVRRKHAHITTKLDVTEFVKEELPNDKTDDHKDEKQVNNGTDVPLSVEQANYQNEEMDKKNQEIDKTEEVIETIGTTKKKKKQMDGKIHNHEHNIAEPEKIPQAIEDHTKNKTDVAENSKEPSNQPEISLPIDIIAIEMMPDHCEESGHYHGAAFQDNNESNKISTYLLEMGIALHSILIGLTLGTTTDSFIALFIALCFHQFFEAIALGAQIANLKSASNRSAILMVVFFSLTTPLGIAIGIGVHSGTYNPKSVSSLIITGILDSLAAGILIYVALVNLITAEMGPNAHGFYSLSRRLKFLYFAALYLGVGAMAVIGRWA